MPRSPVDYFDASRDTLKRALGQRLVPSLPAWTKLRGENTYVCKYGGRLYRITQVEGTFTTGYDVTVQPGVTQPVAWINGGDESKYSVYYGLRESAVADANRHALKYGPVP